MTRWEKALQEYHAFKNGIRNYGAKVTKRHAVPGCYCEGAWWRMTSTHLGTDMHIAKKYKVDVRTLQMLIFLIDDGATHVPELCALLDSFTNLTGQPLTMKAMRETLKGIQGDTDGANTETTESDR